MKNSLLYILCAACAWLAPVAAAAQSKTAKTHIYFKNDDKDQFEEVPLSSVAKINFTDENGDESYDKLTVTFTDGTTRVEDLDAFHYVGFSQKLPEIHIDFTDEQYKDVTEIPSANGGEKDTYYNCTVSVVGNGFCDDVAPIACTIKGRGNTTWGYPKKPYRLKFKKKAKLLPEEIMNTGKNYALLANYMDYHKIRNMASFKLGQLLGLPFTHHQEAVEVYINGNYHGLYTLTEHMKLASNSIVLNENIAYYFSIESANADEPCIEVADKDKGYSFKAEIKGSYPEINNPFETGDWGTLDKFLADKQTIHNEVWMPLQNAIGTESQWDVIDMPTLVDYLLVFNITFNKEIFYPKSVKLIVEMPTSLTPASDELGNPLDLTPVMGDHKYRFAPMWDFDWTFGAGANNKKYLFEEDGQSGYKFFMAMIKDNKEFMDVYRARFKYFKENLLEEWLQYLTLESIRIKQPTIRDGLLWQRSGTVQDSDKDPYDYDTNFASLLKFINDRIEFMSTDPNLGLYE